jgi:hypothetical protein
MSATYIDKQPSEILPVTVSFENLLPSGETLQNTSTVTAYVEGVSTPSFLSGSPDISSPYITQDVTGGTDGVDYKLTFIGFTDGGYRFEYDVVVQVRSI